MKNFKVKIVFRIFILTVSIFAVFYFYQFQDLPALSMIFVFAVIYQVFSLIKLVDTTNNELSRFLLGIIHSDFSQTFYRKSPVKSFDQLHNTFNEIIQKFQRIRIDREEHYQYLLTVMQHVGIGLIATREHGEIDFINDAAKKLLRIKFLNKVRSLNRVGSNLGDVLLELRNGERKNIEINFEDDSILLVLYAKEFKLRNEWYKLISLQDIMSELEEKEMEAWQKLIRVLTHEIMNSVTPISSLAGTVKSILETNEGSSFNLDSEIVDDIKSAVTAIKKRSEGLLNFVDKYRSLTKIPKPNFQNIKIAALFDRIQNLMENEFRSNNIEFEIKVSPENLELFADPDLLEQVILNLLINAKQAVQQKAGSIIRLISFRDISGKINILVKDNGPGIAKDIQNKIFIPFFSTKQNGSGIGLSLSRQIILAHGGTIKINSRPDEETTVLLRF